MRRDILNADIGDLSQARPEEVTVVSSQYHDQLELLDLSAHRLWRGYRPKPGVYDELLQPDGQPRAHWRAFIAGLDAMPDGELEQRWAMAERMVQENGVSYDVFADPDSADRPWAFDGVPLILPPEEWAQLEAGLVQRAHLLNALLADVYGPQHLVREGLIPPALVMGNPQFLRPCHGIQPRGGVFLHFYAADLARGPDGRWRVLSDRTEAPTGSGFALENRIILSQCLSEGFAEHKVNRLASFFQQMHDKLVALSGRANPRIVLLSPGSRSEAFFAHAYKARYLGYTLVEGADLTVRSDRVFLKTVEGLQPVDVIMRRIDSDAADPLQLSSGSDVGTAGLVRAAHAGSVVIANALGSAVLENQGLMAFLPDLCRHLTGESLLLESAATWWCGDGEAAAVVRDNLDRLAIRSTFARHTLLSHSPNHIVGSMLTPEHRAALRSRIEHRGYNYVGQELLPASTMPVWEDGHLRPRPVVLRVFVAATEDGYAVMPGGLARIADSDESRAVSVQRGDRTKDTWVLSEGPVNALSLLPTPLSVVNVRRTSQGLPSRTADNLFWLGRYTERAEDMIRLLRTSVSRLTEGDGVMVDTEAVASLVHTLAARGANGSAETETVPADQASIERQIRSLLFDPDQAYGLPETLSSLHRTAAAVRHRLSVDAWRTLNEDILERPWHPRVAHVRPAVVLAQLNGALATLSAFSGLEMENMTRSHGWRFLDMGRRIERALHMAQMFKDLTVEDSEALRPGLTLLLEAADSFMTYRSRYLSTPLLEPVLDLLLLDEANPRSVAFQLAALQDNVDELPQSSAGPGRAPEQRVIMAGLTDLRLSDIAELCRVSASGRRAELDALLDAILAGLPKASEHIARNYFSHAEAVHTGAVHRADQDET